MLSLRGAQRRGNPLCFPPVIPSERSESRDLACSFTFQLRSVRRSFDSLRSLRMTAWAEGWGLGGKSGGLPRPLKRTGLAMTAFSQCAKETLNNSSAAGQRIFSPIRAVQKTGNTYSIPPFSEPSVGEKSLAASSCRIIQSFPKHQFTFPPLFQFLSCGFYKKVLF